jgi:hypothetical protein
MGPDARAPSDQRGEGCSLSRTADDRCHARLRGRIKVAAFQRGVTVPDMLRDLLSREFPDNAGDAA